MASEWTQEAVLRFLADRGGRVRNVDLTDHFRSTIPTDHLSRTAAKDAFKRCVDSIAFVKVENGEKYVCLKKKFRGSVKRSDERKTTKTDEDEDAKQDLLPGSGYGTGGDAQPPLRISESVSLGIKAESRVSKPEMGNQLTDNGGTVNEPDRETSETLQASQPLASEMNSSGTGDGDSASVNSCSVDDENAVVTLDPLEHEWMMCASDGQWESLHRLLTSEPNLISKKDFVTGFTCFHWAAKQGKPELLAVLVNFAKQHEVAVNINARSSAGYTPLHLAAMHNHIEVVKLLVGAYDADVEVRDYSGKKAGQYLRSDVARDIFDIIGAGDDWDAVDAGVAVTGRWRLSKLLQSNLRPLKLLNQGLGEGDACDNAGVAKPLRRKASLNKFKPRLSKIVHSTSLFERLEREAGEASGSVKSRPKSNLFG
uniref:SOWAHA-C winged helix-turn-helix domain-containing protein n=1 Tax=Electrophorus electricus TaxID=8005 RepID=A0A4W4FBV4_ELEEL